MAYAGFWNRALASIADYLLIAFYGCLFFGAGALAEYVILTGRMGYSPDALITKWQNVFELFWGTTDPMKEGPYAGVFGIFLWGFTVLYHSLYESSPWGASPGKRWRNIQVVDMEGVSLSFPQAMKRNAFKVFSLLSFSIGYLFAAFTSRKQALHDIMSKCLVVKK